MNILKMIDGYMEGNTWEQLCVHCYRLRYQDQHYAEIPAKHRGDAGIEGFTRHGIVHQCYCPERIYSDNELYEHQRNKMTEDIDKLFSPNCVNKLNEWGVPCIVEWHFNIPEYKDSRILKHAETKRKLVLNTKGEKPDTCGHIHNNFQIIIKTASDLAPEISRLVRNKLTDPQLNLAFQHTGVPNWSECDSDKVKNIQRKIKAAMLKENDTDIDLNIISNLYIEFYVKGLEIMKFLRLNMPDIYEEIYALEQSYKKDVQIKTLMNQDKKMNQQIFQSILSEFQAKLEKDFLGVLTQASIGELKHDLVASWLADCSMEFRNT